MKGEIFKHGRGFMPASMDTERVLHRMSPGEIAWVKFLRIRDPQSHRRYWQLMTMCAQNCEKIQLPNGGIMAVHGKEDVHTAIKLCTGHVTTILDAKGKIAYQLPKSTDYESMTADEWEEYMPRVRDVIQERILPGVSFPEMEQEILKVMGMAA